MRRTITVTMPGTHADEPGKRDAGKVFQITEMPADQGERWCAQVLVLIAEAVREAVPTETSAAALAEHGINFADARVAKALMDPSLNELWDCIKYQHRPGQPLQSIVHGENSQIEEISTRARLRMEVLKLHLGFTPAGAAPPTSASLSPSPA